MAASRRKLPNEIWFIILDLVPRQDLLNLSLVSKKIHDLVEPVLYSELGPEEGEMWEEEPEKWVGLFFRTIIENPSLASHVKTMKICVPTHGSLDVSFLTKRHRALLKKRIPASAFPKGFQKMWFQGIESRQNWDAVVAFILLQTSQKLRYLIIGHCGYLSFYYYIRNLLLAHKAAVGDGPCSGLQMIDISHNPGMETETSAVERVKFNLLIPFLTLPSIAEVRVYDLSEDSSLVRFELNSTVNHVMLTDCVLSDSLLKKFLSSLTALKSLHWIDMKLVTVADLCGVISRVPRLKAHLEELVMDLEGVNIPHESRLNLSDFKSLKTLKVDSETAFHSVVVPSIEIPLHLRSTGSSAQDSEAWRAFASVAESYFHKIRDDPRYQYADDQISDLRAALPKCIKSLTITGCGYPMYNCAGRFVSTKDGKLPDLKYLKLTFQRAEEGVLLGTWNEKSLQDTCKVARKNGIRLICVDEEE